MSPIQKKSSFNSVTNIMCLYSDKMCLAIMSDPLCFSDERTVVWNEYCGYLLRTKPAEMSEGGTATGIGALDSPLLVDTMEIVNPLKGCCVSRNSRE